MKRLCAVAVAILIALVSCGDDPAPTTSEILSWARVAPEQIAEAKKYGVPAAFENDLGMRFMLIPAGTFVMGSRRDEEGRDWDEVQQAVRLSRPYYMQIREVTNSVFRRWKPEHDSDFTSWDYTLNGCSQPVHATWDEVEAFANWLSEEDGRRRYRLPTEAEWEYACRAGTNTPYYWGESRADACLYENVNSVKHTPSADHTGGALSDPDGHISTAPVGSYPPNPWGLHDMLGNMDEWCQDWYAECPWDRSHVPGAEVDPTGPAATDMHVVRSSFCLADWEFARCASRTGLGRLVHPGVAGFRLVSPLPEPGER